MHILCIQLKLVYIIWPILMKVTSDLHKTGIQNDSISVLCHVKVKAMDISVYDAIGMCIPFNIVKAT